jgi:Fe-S-cluster containining protein
VPAARTLGQFVEEEGVLAALAESVTEINARATREAKLVGRTELLKVVQCFACTAPKTCCSSFVTARLYEGVLVAAHLVRAGRDTPELRAALDARAAQMETASPYGWRMPCLFLDANERCTVYAARPTACGSLYVYTPPAACSDPAAVIDAYVPHAETAAATLIEEQFRERLALRKKIGRRYVGVLPRMVLVALAAWDRTDFREYLRGLDWPGDDAIARWQPRGA